MLATEVAGVALEAVAVVDVASSCEAVKSRPDAVMEVEFAAAAVAAVGLNVVHMQLSSSDLLRVGTEDIRTLAVAFAAVAGRIVGCWDRGFEMTLLKQGSLTEAYGTQVGKGAAFGWPP